MTSLEPKIEKSRTQCNFKILFPHPNLTSNFETHKSVGDNFYFLYKYIYISSKCPQSSKKFKGHFSGPSHKTRPFASGVGVGTGPRRDVVGILVLSHHLKITPCTCVSKANFQTEKKSHLPAVISIFLTMTNNLTINFKTHKNFFENF